MWEWFSPDTDVHSFDIHMKPSDGSWGTCVCSFQIKYVYTFAIISPCLWNLHRKTTEREKKHSKHMERNFYNFESLCHRKETHIKYTQGMAYRNSTRKRNLATFFIFIFFNTEPTLPFWNLTFYKQCTMTRTFELLASPYFDCRLSSQSSACTVYNMYTHWVHCLSTSERERVWVRRCCDGKWKF